MKQNLLFLCLMFFVGTAIAQKVPYANKVTEYQIQSEYLKAERTHWVSLPLRYSDTLKYPVIYVLDAEWRFDLIKDIVFDLGGNNKMPKSIIVGIPHVDWKEQRGIDLTFSHSRMEYDGEAVDSTWYNSSNSGGGQHFYDYLTKELIPAINKEYATNGHETLIGHSYGGYFGGYILSLDHPFEVLHIYDPSIWYSDGEVTQRFLNTTYLKPTKIHLTYQPIPAFHKAKIEAFIAALEENKHIILSKTFYPKEQHNALFLDSFYDGILKTNQ